MHSWKPSTLCRRVVAGAAFITFLSTPAFIAHAQSTYAVKDHWKIGGEGGWDYLAIDPQTHTLYVTHSDRVEVIDTKSGKVIGSIGGLKGTHGVAFDGAGKYGYISDGKANAIVVFDRHSREIVTSIPAGTNPDGILFEPVSGTVWAFNGRSNNATVIDAAQNKVVGTVELPGRPEFPVADGKGTIFVNIEDKNEVVRLDAKAKKVTATWSISPAESPSGLAIDTAHRRLFSVCDGKRMVVLNADTGKIVATPEIGEGPDAAAFDAKKGLAFSSNGDGTLTVIKEKSPDSFSVVQTVPTQKGARTMALDPVTGRIYLPSAEFGPRPDPTPQNPHPRPAIVPGSFVVLVVDSK
jgi:DNA-binding beta-propeller fold protein YncE